MGYSRAVVAGNHVYVAGTAPIPPDGDPPEGGYEQTRLCLGIILGALERAGARARTSFERDLPRRPSAFDDVAGHTARCSPTSARNTTILIPGLVDPRWLLEIDATPDPG